MNKKNEFPSFLKCRKCDQIVTLHGGNWKRWHWPKRYAYCVKCYRDDPEGYDSKLTRAASEEKNAEKQNWEPCASVAATIPEAHAAENGRQILALNR